MDQYSLSALLLFTAGALIYKISQPKRSAFDVLVDLEDEAPAEQRESESKLKDGGAKRRRPQQIGIRSESERKRVQHFQRLFPALGVLGALTLIVISGKAAPLSLVSGAVFGLSLGYLAYRRYLTKRSQLYCRQIDFYLPVVMERLVMGVQAGLDVFATLRTLVELEKTGGRETSRESDPVTELLQDVYRLSERGVGFEDSLREVAERVPSPALKHAFLHLGVAHREGGELVYPLRELSDSTQLYFQETVEEEIARLPVKATLPLLVTFVGLLILFVTAPMLQVLDFLASAGPK